MERGERFTTIGIVGIIVLDFFGGLDIA